MTSLLERDRRFGNAAEEEIAEILAKKWGCSVRRTPLFDYYDFDFDREGKTVAIAELKTRRCRSDDYEETFLALEKWYRLTDISRSMGVAGLFVVNFLNEIRFIEVGDVDARKHVVGGRTDRPEMPHDITTKILVPVTSMKRIAK